VTANRTLDQASARLFEAARARPWSAPLILAGFMVLAFVARMWLNARLEAPWIMPDELTHAEMARSFIDGEGLEVRELPSYARTLYPVLVSPAWLADSAETAFAAAKTINTALMTLACIPLYLWARRFLSEGWALATAALGLLLPAFAYTGSIMTESAALPLFVFAFWAFARALETPTVVWQLVAVAAVLPAVAVRLQALVLFAVLLTAIVLDALVAAWDAESRIRTVGARLRVYAATGRALLVLAFAFFAYALFSAGRLSDVFGGYRTVLDLDYSFWAGLRWTVLHAAELVLAVGVLPVSAFLLLAGAWLRPGSSPAERAFASVAASALLWIVPQAGFFASRYSLRIEERNTFYVEPLLLLALVAWVARGAPRPPRATAVAVVVPVALLAAIPIERLFGAALLAATFGLLPLLRVSAVFEGGADTMRVLVALGAVAAGLLLVFVPRRLAATTIAAVAVFLALSSWSVAGTLREQANATGRETQTTNSDWVDDEVGADADVGFIFTADLVDNSHPVWQTEFWNRSVGDVYGLNAADATSLPTVPITIDARGRIVRVADRSVVAPRYVLAQPGQEIAGDKLAAEGRLVLYRVSAPMRLSRLLEGVYADGWSGKSAAYTNYSQRAGTVRVDVGRAGWTGPDVPSGVTIDVERLDSGRRVSSARLVVHSGKERTFRLKTPTAPFRVKVGVERTFSPADYGSPDTRELGVQLDFVFQPAAQAKG
jgi:hypothetical protein